MTSEITITESRRLVELERKIKSGLNTFVEVGEALLEIRDSRLYRIEHGTFEQYCREKWQMTDRHARNLIAAASVTASISKSGTIVPKTETQARPLTKLPAEKQPEAWEKAVEAAGGKQPTAKQVEAAVEVIAPAKKPKAEPEPQPAKPRGFPAMVIANNAINHLGTMLRDDPDRVAALQMVGKFVDSELS